MRKGNNLRKIRCAFRVEQKDSVRHLEKNGCIFLCEGGNHTVIINRIEKKVSTVPRHREIDRNLQKEYAKIRYIQTVTKRSNRLHRSRKKIIFSH